MDHVPTILVSSTPMPHRSGRVVIQLDRFIYFRESFKAIPEEHEIDPIDYDEERSNVDVHIWKKVMKVELESMYSN